MFDSTKTPRTTRAWKSYLLFGVTAFIAGVTFEIARSGAPLYVLWTALASAVTGFIGGWIFDSVIGVARDTALGRRERRRYLREVAALRQEIARLRWLLDANGR